MDWKQEAERIRQEQALDSEVLAALLNAPPEHLDAIVKAVEPLVRQGHLSITPYDWGPVMARLRSLEYSWPGPKCEQCGSPLGEEGSSNNYGSGICWFCYEG